MNRTPKGAGFTLVELLVVVGIIGILSTIGVPTYRRMVQKAMKAEAKTNLGGLYHLESTFFAEYSVYGNRLRLIGYSPESLETDGLQHPGRYSIGFYQELTDPTSCLHIDGPKPTVGTGFLKLNQLAPQYFAGSTETTNFIGKGSPLRFCSPSKMSDDGSSYRASASGVLSSSAVVAPSGYVDEMQYVDQWTIDQDRVLLNDNDGVF